MANKTFPEINAMNNVADIRLALRMGYNNFDSAKEEYKPELKARLEAMEDRLRRLKQTAADIERATVSIKRTARGFNITRAACVVCGEPPFGDEYCCGHSQEVSK